MAFVRSELRLCRTGPRVPRPTRISWVCTVPRKTMQVKRGMLSQTTAEQGDICVVQESDYDMPSSTHVSVLVTGRSCRCLSTWKGRLRLLPKYIWHLTTFSMTSLHASRNARDSLMPVRSYARCSDVSMTSICTERTASRSLSVLPDFRCYGESRMPFILLDSVRDGSLLLRKNSLQIIFQFRSF